MSILWIWNLDMDMDFLRISNFILLDTRSKAEYDVSHIENSVWVGEKDWDLKSFKKI